MSITALTAHTLLYPFTFCLLSCHACYVFLLLHCMCLDYDDMRQRYIDEGFLVWIIPSKY